MASSAEESHTEVEDKEERKKQCRYPEEAKQLPYWKLFKFADSCDILFMLVGTVAAIINGLAFPILTIIQSRIINTLGTYQNDPSKIADEVSRDSTYLIYNALVAWAGSYLYVSCWMRAGERQASKIRAQYLHAILRQNVAFFDTEMCTAEVVKNVSSDSMLVQEAISQKVGEFVQNLFQFIGGFLVGFIQVWKLAIVLVPFTPLLLLPGYFYGKALSEYENRRQHAYDKAGIVAEQAISSIRTVHAFAAEKSTLNMFSRSLEPAIKLGLRQGFAKGLAMGSNGVTFALWSFTAWYGSELIMHGHANGAQVMTTGFALLAGGLALGNATPNMRAFIEGCTVAGKIFRMIERIPPIDIEDDSGTRLEKVNGEVQFKNVSFAYPSRPHQLVFDDLELKIEASKTIALVGGSGSGKSTILALIERFYDPQTGSIYLDDVDIRKLQLKWYRDQIALVSQQPILFATTIKENILVGKEYATIEEVVEAAKIANAHSFIVKQPLGYDTQVGEHGVQLSGGQKQRVAIARAMLRKPHILLLDEATSALDTKSERKVQEAFIKASMRRTTIVVAHRLSTIQNADYIAVIKGGKVVELGPHETLLEREDGIYKNLLRLQHVHEDVPREYDRISSPYNQQDKVEEDMQEATNLMAEQDSICPLDIRPKHRLSLRRRKIQKQVPKASLWRLAKLNTPEWKQILCGLFGAIAFGFVQPLYAFTLGKMASAFYNSNYMELKRSVRLYSTVFIGLFVASFMVNIIQHYNFAIAGEYLTKRIRERMLDAILGFEIAWFDEEKNTSGAICVRLASDAALVRTLIGDRISLMVQIGSATIVSFALGTITCWRLALLMIAIQPIIIFCYYLKRTLLERFAEKRANAEQEASQIAAEAVSQHRTVAAFSSHERILLIFQSKIDKSMKETVKNAYTAGFAMGVAQFILYASWGLDYWYGGILIREGKNTFAEVLITFFILVSTGRIVAEAGAMTPDLAKGSTATKSVFDILDRKTMIDADSNKANESSGIEKGDLQFSDIIFAYPSRPNVIVLNKFNLTIQSSQSVAIVGQSGSGKSTIVGLIERFYDPISGVILIDGQDIRNFHLKTLRQQIGLVCQEPTLFATTIRENICYGNENITETEIVRAAIASNAHDFISTLPNGYNTFVGEQGLQLSGGQRQRIAIARTILKNPKILLLDEATSALDAESESIVQMALDQIMVGRTTVIIAHKLSTIQNASSIVVVQDGVVLEQGTHKELISKGQAGAYHSMIQMQTSNPTK